MIMLLWSLTYAFDMHNISEKNTDIVDNMTIFNFSNKSVLLYQSEMHRMT